MTITPLRPAAEEPRELIGPALFARLSLRVQDDAGTDRHTADRIVEQALGFLQVCALNPANRLAPSERVDAGWHAFILHTREYAEFCDRVAGRFIHHIPAIPGKGEDGPEAVNAAIEAMRSAGFHVDASLWAHSAKCDGNCSQCYAGCADDPMGA